MEQIKYDPSVNYDIGSGPLEAVNIESQIAQAHQDQQRLDSEFLDQMSANQEMVRQNQSIERQNLQNKIKDEQAALQKSAQQLQQLGQFS